MIEARGLTKRYGRKLAVDELSFEVRPGVVTGFLGPNGAGKSTTMRLMLGLARGRGVTLFNGRPYRKLKHPLREVGAMLETPPYHPARKARDHLRMLAAANGIPRGRVDEVLELVGLTSVGDKRPKSYSMGMTQRLGLAAAMLGDPQTLILDEPANGLDPQAINWLRGFLRAFAAQGRCVFVSSHLLAEMALMADHLVVISRGRLITSEPVADFVKRGSHSSVVVRSPHVARLARLLTREGAKVVHEDGPVISVIGVERAEIGELAFRNGIVLHELADRAATLEEAFLEATSEEQATGVGHPGDSRAPHAVEPSRPAVQPAPAAVSAAYPDASTRQTIRPADLDSPGSDPEAPARVRDREAQPDGATGPGGGARAGGGDGDAPGRATAAEAGEAAGEERSRPVGAKTDRSAREASRGGDT
ncbi:ABC transporter related protein [Carbonactinospora thermoautotrophica]|uniref:ABC transporter related protein n=1 Tax=Carbonactinospora thermoautotrophica TaxID=1469144 RepID=A0A132MPL9_9ACTN|nr:ATP-binding cassette domain-containing protein [Carbonactinospora thermoautotrophica]KWW99782.1 ABC transporter related protein [Carbonactinospora thermoautotrophica]